jgi:hypothetical protein
MLPTADPFGRDIQGPLEEDDLYGCMLRDDKAVHVPGSVRMPAYKPHVVASFSSLNLKGRYGVNAVENGLLEDAQPAKAAVEPWAICDYLREALSWPTDVIYIDAEQAGMYNVDPYVAATGRHHLHGTVHGTDDGRVGSRNWKAQYSWAQRQADVQLIFLSSTWLASMYCCGELADYFEDVRNGKRVPSLVFVILEERFEFGHYPWYARPDLVGEFARELSRNDELDGAQLELSPELQVPRLLSLSMDAHVIERVGTSQYPIYVWQRIRHTEARPCRPS